MFSRIKDLIRKPIENSARKSFSCTLDMENFEEKLKFPMVAF